MKATSALTLAIAAGCIASPAMANNTPVQKEGTMPAKMIGHIYFNVVTGEKIATALSDGIRPVDGEAGTEVWMADNNTPCADFGQTAGTAVVVDAPNGEFGFPTVEGDTSLDWGDIEADSVIDCVQLDYFNSLEDVDTDSDSIGDGIEGFAAQWAFYDADNGFDSCFDRTGLVAFTIFGLSGQLDGPGGFGGYFFTIDLAGSFGSSLAFEIGDTDSDPQEAAVHNPMINADADSSGFGDADLDSDGNADWSMSVQYIQPGTQDVDDADSDSDTQTGIDGDVADKNLTAIGLAAPFGTVTDNGDGTFTLTPDAGVNATGAEDGYDVFDNTGFYTGTFWMGGFSCNDPADGTVNAFTQIDLIMYGPGTVNPLGCDGADLAEPYGVHDIFDVLAFIAAFNASEPAADFADPAGVFDIFDVLGFIAEFNDGCPL